MAVVKNRMLRIAFVALGFLSVGVGFLGVFLPLIPTVGPILLAGFFFSRSSERFDDWLVNNRYFGGAINDWRAGAGFSVKGKVIAVTAITFSFTLSIITVTDHVVMRLALVMLGIAIATYVVTRPTKPAHTMSLTS